MDACAFRVPSRAAIQPLTGMDPARLGAGSSQRPLQLQRLDLQARRNGRHGVFTMVESSCSVKSAVATIHNMDRLESGSLIEGGHPAEAASLLRRLSLGALRRTGESP